MLHVRRWCWLAAGLVLSACHSDNKPPAAAPGTPPATAPTGTAGSPGASYRIYRGALPGAADSITLHLLVAPPRRNDTEIAGIFASYHGADGQPYQLYGELRAHGDSLQLTDGSYEKLDAHSNGPVWRLRWQDAHLVGTRAGQPIRLRELRPAGSLAFAVQYFADSVAAFPELANSPYGHLSLQAALPVGSSPAQAALTRHILRQLRGDTVAGLPAWPLDRLWQNEQEKFTRFYRSDVAESRPSPADSVTGPFGYGLHYQQQQAMYVYWNEDDLLSLGYFSYSFTGGAHGGYHTRVRSYDARTGQPLGKADVFLPGTDAALSAALGRAVRRTLRLPAGEPLSEMLFVAKMPVTDNFYLTDSGVVFVYAPYEIAAYALGEVSVFVPFTEIKSLLKPAAEPLS